LRLSARTAFSAPGTIIAGPDGAMRFTENNANKIGRITAAGEIIEIEIPMRTRSRKGWHSRPMAGCGLRKEMAEKLA